MTEPPFEDLFGSPPAVRAQAPGRVNLIGEHTDYNGGFVLPIATPQDTKVDLRPRGDRTVSAWSANIAGANQRISYQLGEEMRTGEWGDYVAGVTQALGERGAAIEGFDARITSTVPLGGGLSSSASLEVALLRALNECFRLGLDAVAIAKVAHRAETDLVGAPVGIMDQMAASLADERAALFLDTRSLESERLPLPPSSALIVIHSGISHKHVGGEYRVRRAECDEAARRLGVALLRDVTVEQLPTLHLPPPLDRRVRHVVTENDRVLRARTALQQGDATTFGTLMNASHQSMRDDFEVSISEIDTLVDIAQRDSAVLGARLTGGGFGGSIVALAASADAAVAADRIAAQYASRVAAVPMILIP